MIKVTIQKTTLDILIAVVGFRYTNCSCWICDEDSNAIKRRTSISGSVETIEEITTIAKICGIDIDFKD